MGIDARMFVRTFSDVSDDQIKHWSWELGAAFGPTKFGLYGGAHALQRVSEVWEDTERGTLTPDFGETFIEVNLATRYYGPGYERGDLPGILNIAVYLERKIPGASVWYGGDSSGVEFVPLHSTYKTALWNHFVDKGHLPYIDGFDRLSDPQGKRPKCERCDMPMSQQGFGKGGAWALYVCLGCSNRLELKDGKLQEPPRRCEHCLRPYPVKEG